MLTRTQAAKAAQSKMRCRVGKHSTLNEPNRANEYESTVWLAGNLLPLAPDAHVERRSQAPWFRIRSLVVTLAIPSLCACAAGSAFCLNLDPGTDDHSIHRHGLGRIGHGCLAHVVIDGFEQQCAGKHRCVLCFTLPMRECSTRPLFREAKARTGRATSAR